MDKTPKSLRFVRNGNDDNSPVFSKSNITSTPVKQTKKPRIWDNDIYNQENSIIDVAWDWDSPKNIKPKALHRSKIEYEEIPKLPTKKISQVDHIKNFEKLKEELQALRNEIARVDDDCLALSLDEQTFREESAKESDDLNSFIEQQYFHSESQETENLLNMDDNLLKIKHNTSVDNLFNDSCEEQLLVCTQMLEERLLQSNVKNIKILTSIQSQKNILKHQNQGNCAINSSIIHDSEVSASCTSSSKKDIKQNDIAVRTSELKENISSDILLPTNTIVENSILFNKTADDSFDAVLKDFEDEDIDTLTQMNNNNTKSFIPRKFQTGSNLNTSFKRTFSDATVQYNPKNVESTKVNKFSFHRTHSFESAATKEVDLPKHIMEEIERKRKEALARLKERKEKEKYQLKTTDETYSNVSPLKCSPEEIEQKRLQAQAIRKAKQKEIIERNRLEALKRLEMNRQKRLSNKKALKIK